MKTEKQEEKKRYAQAVMDGIKEMVQAVKDAKTDKDREDAEDRIREDALSVEVRSGWYNPSILHDNRSKDNQPEEFRILLTTCGPACQIVGELDEYLQPRTATIQDQDWFTPWSNLPLEDGEEEILLEYCRYYWFGE